jgi:hypothetical protein
MVASGLTIMAGKTVTWVIRTSGAGPGFFLSPEGRGPYRSAFASYYNRDNAWARFLHRSSFGKKIVEGAWGVADQATVKDAKFRYQRVQGRV